MGRQTVRPAGMADAHTLARVKCRHVQALYRGMLSPEYLKSLNETFYLAQIQQWLAGEYQVDVLENDGEAAAFIAYGADPKEKACGLIYEAGMLPVCGLADATVLLHHSLHQMAGQYPVTRVIIPRDNLRTRFLYEQMGFRPDGYQSTTTVDGCELRLMRLIGRTGA